MSHLTYLLYLDPHKIIKYIDNLWSSSLLSFAIAISIMKAIFVSWMKCSTHIKRFFGLQHRHNEKYSSDSWHAPLIEYSLRSNSVCLPVLFWVWVYAWVPHLCAAPPLLLPLLLPWSDCLIRQPGYLLNRDRSYHIQLHHLTIHLTTFLPLAFSFCIQIHSDNTGALCMSVSDQSHVNATN